MAKPTFSKFRSRWWAFCEIDRQLRRGRTCTPQSLAQDLEVDARTARRYVQFMREELGAPITFDRSRGSYVLGDPCWSMPNIALSLDEIRSLAIAVQALTPTVPAPFAASLTGLLEKLLDALPAEQRQAVARARQQVDYVPVAVQSKGGEWVPPLFEAISEHRTVEMTYFTLSRNAETRRRVDPYHLRYYEGAWYLVGYDHRSRHWPIFNLARIRRLSVTDRLFDPRTFNARQYFRHSFGVTVGGQPRQVQVRLTGWIARTAGERVWPEGFTYEPLGEDQGILTGRLAKLDDLVHWVAATGGEAEILIPAD